MALHFLVVPVSGCSSWTCIVWRLVNSAFHESSRTRLPRTPVVPKYFQFPRGERQCVIASPAQNYNKFNFRVSIRIRNYITSQNVSHCIMDLVRRTAFIKETAKKFVKLRKCYPLILLLCVCVCVCVCVCWKKLGINRFKWRAHSAKVA